MVRELVISELAGSRCMGSNPTYDCTWARYSRRCWACSEFVSVGDASPREINSKGLSNLFIFLSLSSTFFSFSHKSFLLFLPSTNFLSLVFFYISFSFPCCFLSFILFWFPYLFFLSFSQLSFWNSYFLFLLFSLFLLLFYILISSFLLLHPTLFPLYSRISLSSYPCPSCSSRCIIFINP